MNRLALNVLSGSPSTGLASWIPRVGRPLAGLIVVSLAIAALVLEQLLEGGRGLVMGIVLLTLAPSLLRAGGARLHPLDPETLVPGAFFLSSGYAATRQLLTDPALRLRDYMLPGLRVALVAVFACSLLSTVASRELAPPEDEPTDGIELSVNNLDRAAIGVGFLSLAMVGVFIGMVGFKALMSMSYSQTYLAEDGRGTLVAGWYGVQLVTAYLVSRCLTFYRAGVRVPRLMIVLVLLFMLAYTWQSVLGRRGPLIWMVASVILVAHMNGIVLRRLWFVVGIVLVGVYSFAMEGMRDNLGSTADAQIDGARRRLEQVKDPLVVSELEGIWRNLVVIVAERPSLLEYPGESYVSAVLMLVPKPLWPDRPTGLAQRYVAWMDPREARAGGGLAFNAAAEGYLNFGEIGVALEVMGMTWLFFGPVTACLRRRKSSMAQALAACVASYSYNQYRAESCSLLKILVTFFLAVAAIELLRALIAAVLGADRLVETGEPASASGRLAGAS